ncbi:hypothetical protein BIU97_16880 [Curtobacterium sp. MCBA15_009]|nr:hypothetical protein BIU92_03235 [Curtobacterium sp. MCBA15_003]OII13809.1 hypothetical protein BIU97_16880 [Curtobacterium sp. MCBA15_009]OII29182.1 hypothetical protein BIU94_13935 [Curtobacterium sp. MMLR14_006]
MRSGLEHSRYARLVILEHPTLLQHGDEPGGCVSEDSGVAQWGRPEVVDVAGIRAGVEQDGDRIESAVA